MELIKEIHIKGFRSIQELCLPDVNNFVALAGLNNSGKSNILRALNAFFTGYTDEGYPLDVLSDYYRADLRKKQPKEISIAITFSLPTHFSFRRELTTIADMLGTKFTIKKSWPKDYVYPHYYLNDNMVELNDRHKIDQFLQLINFRYIPNRVMPVDVIKKEHHALRDVLIRRLGRKAKGNEQAFNAIRDTSSTLINDLVQRLTSAAPDLGAIRLDTPTSWNELIFAFGYKIGQGSFETADSEQGSGIQSLLMLETLYMIDLDYFQKFGWRQASIWAIEEPESSLHASLEAKTADFLSTISSKPNGRLQVICTTHSDLVVQYADKTFVVNKENSKSSVQSTESPKEALEILSCAGVSRWTHPLLFNPLEPIILVEGKFDCTFLEEAFKRIRPARKIVISYLEHFNGAKTGGTEDILKYIKEHKAVIKSRRNSAPIIVVLDWEVKDKKVDEYKQVLVDDSYTVFKWPTSALNPMITHNFHGIERAYSNRILEAAITKNASIGKTAAGKYTIGRDDLGDTKRILKDIVAEGLLPGDLDHVRAFILELQSAAIRNCDA